MIVRCFPGSHDVGVELIHQETGRKVIDVDGIPITSGPKIVVGTGWRDSLRKEVRNMLEASQRFLECEVCEAAMTVARGVVTCTECEDTVTRDCPRCGAAMKLSRASKHPRNAFWACTTYPSCRAAVSWSGEESEQPPVPERREPPIPKPEPKPKKPSPEVPDAPEPTEEEGEQFDFEEEAEDEDLRFDQAREILEDPLVADSKTAKTLLKLLDEDPEKVFPLVLGETTPSGRSTVQQILKEKRRSANKPRKKLARKKDKQSRAPRKKRNNEDPTYGLELYTEFDNPPGGKLETITVPTTGGTTMSSSAFRHHQLRHDELNPIQTAVHPLVEKNVNVVVATRTSTGKSIVAEMFMADALERGGKAIFLSPLRAVSREKYEDWTDEEHPWGQFGVEILTGDYELTTKKKTALRRADVIVMTSEMLDSKTRRMENEGNTWLLKTLCIVVDEAHLLTMKGRGDALECGLMRFSKQNPHARIVLLSATMPNVDQLGGWLTKLNGKPSRLIQSDWRPTKLTVHWPSYHARSGHGTYHANEASKRESAIDLLQRYPEDKWIVFVHSKKAGHALREELVEANETAEFHNADLDRDSRISLERSFKFDDTPRIVIATSTLAYGINMPARRVLVLGVHRGLSEVDPIDIKQEIGRAGRAGMDAEGDAYILLPHDPARSYKTDEMRRRFEKIDPIASQLNDVDTLAFHLTAEVAECGVSTEAEAVEWHRRSLASHQGRELEEDGSVISAAKVMGKLAGVGILKKTGFRYEATSLGRVSSWLYYSPFDIADWCSNFRKLIEMDKLKDDDCLAWALGTVKSAFSNSYLPREHESDLQDLEWRLRSKGIERLNLPPAALSFYGLLTDTHYKAMVSHQRQLANDCDRIGQAITLIDKHVLKGLGTSYCKLLNMRMRYGCKWEEAELCTIPGVGKKRARQLARSGVTTVNQILSDRASVIEAVGARLAVTIARGAKEIRRKRGGRED